MQSSVERPCPGETVTFTCTISALAHQWSVPSFGITRSLLPGDQGRVISDHPFQFAVTEVVPGTSITSTATVTATSDLNGTLVLCQDGNLVFPDQNSTITLRGMGIMYLYLDKQDYWIIIGHRHNMLRYPYMGIFILCNMLRYPYMGIFILRLCPIYNVKIFES